MVFSSFNLLQIYINTAYAGLISLLLICGE